MFETRLGPCIASGNASACGWHQNNDAQLFKLVKEPVDQASRIRNPGARTPHALDCQNDHRIPSLTMMGQRDTHSS
jgi:hypothetical protein